MLAGNPFLRSFKNTLEQRAINYACLGVPGDETNHFPLQNCPGGIRAQVFFPSCWDGVNMDSPDHKSHMAYPSNVDSGKCPASHPKRFISIFYEVTWETAAFPFEKTSDLSKQPFVWANGDETGYGYHGDFVNGWDVDILQRAVTECTNNSGNIEDCGVLDLYSNDFSKSCKIASSVDEEIEGNLSALPGCNPSSGAGPDAPKAADCGATKTISPPSNPFVDLTASKKFAYIGCGKDNIGGRSLTGARLEQEDMTNEKCVDYCISNGFSIAGTEYSTECYCGNSIPQDRAPIEGLMGDCFMPCGGNEDENCGGTGQISLYKKCDSTCENISYGVNAPVNAPAVPAAPAASSAAPAPVPASSSKAAVVGASPAATSTKEVAGAVPTSENNVKAPADELIETVSASSAISNAQPATTSKAAVVPGTAPKNTKVAPKCAGGEVTVTIAETTITVTKRLAPSAAPETGVKIPAHQNNVAEESSATAPSDEEEDNAPIGGTGPILTATEEPIYPTIAPTGSPFNNGTAFNSTKGNGQGKYRSKGHGRFHHSRRPTGAY